MHANGLRVRREQRGLTQKSLAVAAGVSRQSLNGIETGKAVPSVTLALRLAHCLGCDVETLFGQGAAEELDALLVGPERPTSSAAATSSSAARVIVGFVREQWVAHSLTPGSFAPSQLAADGFIRSTRAGRVQIEAARSPSDLRDTLLIGGCAPGLSVLVDRLNGARGPGRFRWLTQSNTSALRALSQGHVHLSGVHMAKDSGERLAQSLSRHLPTPHAGVYALATWEAGLVVPQGNPRRIRDVAALGHAKLRIALREHGSGARSQLDRLLKQAGLEPESVIPRSIAVKNHMDVAHAVALGAADVGFSIRAVAVALGLDFVPFVQERFDLIVPEDLADDPRVQRMFETLASATFRRELDALGYDAGLCAQKMTEVTAA